jgi:hypothetical protein
MANTFRALILKDKMAEHQRPPGRMRENPPYPRNLAADALEQALLLQTDLRRSS